MKFSKEQILSWAADFEKEGWEYKPQRLNPNSDVIVYDSKLVQAMWVGYKAGRKAEYNLRCKQSENSDIPVIKAIVQEERSKKTATENLLANIDLRKSEIEKMVSEFLDPNDGYTVMGDFTELTKSLSKKGLSDRESLLVIQSFHSAIDLILKLERKRDV